MPGAVRIVRQGNFLGVVAGNEWAAIKGSRQLKATWSAGLPDQATVFDHVRTTKVAKDDMTANVETQRKQWPKRA